MSHTRNKPRDREAGFHRLAIDFDGVLMGAVRVRVFDPAKCLGEPVRGTREALAHLSTRYELTIFSARATNAKGIDAIEAWLGKHDLRQFFKGGITAIKPNALAYIDDRARRFDGWGAILKEFGSDFFTELNTKTIKHGQTKKTN